MGGHVDSQRVGLMGLRINNRFGVWMASRAAEQAAASLQHDAPSPAQPDAKSAAAVVLAGRSCVRNDVSSLEQAGQTLMAQRQVLVRLRELAVAARDPGLVNGRRAAMDAHMGKMLAQLDAAAPGPTEKPAAAATTAKRPKLPSTTLGLDAMSLDSVDRANHSLSQLDEALSRIENDQTAVRLMLNGRSAANPTAIVEADNRAAASAAPPDAQAVNALIRAAGEAVWSMPASGRAQAAPAPSVARVLELLR